MFEEEKKYLEEIETLAKELNLCSFDKFVLTIAMAFKINSINYDTLVEEFKRKGGGMWRI